MTRLKPAATAIVYDNEQLLLLDGIVSLPIGARVEIDRSDYIVHNVRLRSLGTEFDLYYDVHRAEVTGAQPDLLD